MIWNLDADNLTLLEQNPSQKLIKLFRAAKLRLLTSTVQLEGCLLRVHKTVCSYFRKNANGVGLSGPGTDTTEAAERGGGETPVTTTTVDGVRALCPVLRGMVGAARDPPNF